MTYLNDLLTELSSEVFYHRAGRYGTKYDHLDIIVPSSHEYLGVLQKGFYEALVKGNRLIIDLSRLVSGYRLIIELVDEVFNRDVRYLARVRTYVSGEASVKVVVRLPRGVRIIRRT